MTTTQDKPSAWNAGGVPRPNRLRRQLHGPASGLLLISLLFCACPDDEPEDTGPPSLYVENVGDGQRGIGSPEDPFRSLQTAIDEAEDGATLWLMEGRHEAVAFASIDPTCGNCDDESYRADVPITVGFHVNGKAVHLVGESRSRSILDTAAGYGLLFENAGQSSVTNLTVTGGLRDADGRATNAAIVARYTDLLVQDVDVVDNNNLYEPGPDEEDPVAGVMGITGREGAHLTIVGCRIENNSWDGIAVYRSDPDVEGSQVRAVIVDNVIGCTEDCVDPNGRGVGVGVTWDAQAEIVNNDIHHYWKGIGSFGTSVVMATNNVVRDQVGWGVIASGESFMDAINNVIIDNGTTGLAAWNLGASGNFTNNIVTGNGWSVDEWVGKRTGVWMNAPDDFLFTHNDVWANQPFDVCQGGIPGGSDCQAIDFDGTDANLSVDPQFEDDEGYVLGPGSPLIDAGDPTIVDRDQSISDIGLHGGPDSGRTTP